MSAINWTIELGLNDWIAIGSAALALLSFVANLVLVQRQAAMQFESLKAQTDQDILSWANEALEALSEAAWLARGRGAVHSEDSLRLTAHNVMRRLSALADRGRLHFPNLAPDSMGQDKEAAFQGMRPPILDCLIFAYRRLERMDLRNLEADMATYDYISKCRRIFVSEVQNAVDPRRRGRMLQSLQGGAPASGMRSGESGFRAVARLGEELEKQFPGVLLVRRDDAWVEDMERRARAAGRRKA